MLPSHLWRIASIFNQIFNLLPPLPHGEHSLTAFDEIVRFHPLVVEIQVRALRLQMQWGLFTRLFLCRTTHICFEQ